MNTPYDVFISYRQSEPDRSWVRQVLVPAMEQEGLKVFVDYKAFRLGVPLIKEMERAVDSSTYTLAVLTPAYLNSSFTEFENLLSDHIGLESSQRKLICVMREHCHPRAGIRYKLWLDLTTDELFEQNKDFLINTLRQSPDLD